MLPSVCRTAMATPGLLTIESCGFNTRLIRKLMGWGPGTGGIYWSGVSSKLNLIKYFRHSQKPHVC